MMSARRPGFTLVELLVVAVLASLILAAAYRSIIAHERGYRTTSGMIRGQDALRTALGVLEAELREVATSGATVGLTDVTLATQDSVQFFAQRKLGFVCEVLPSDRRMAVWLLDGSTDAFVVGDAAVIFRDGDPDRHTDDTWAAARVSSLGSSTAACPGRPGGLVADQRLNLAAQDGSDIGTQFLVGVQPGAPVRGLQRVTYGLYPIDGGWGLGRRRAGGPVEALIAGLAGPGEGLVFQYLDAQGDPIVSDPVPPGSIAAIEITARTADLQDTPTAEYSSTIFLRNN